MAKSKPTSRRAAAAQEEAPAGQATVVEQQGGWETGVAILTAILLVVACLLVDRELGPLGAGVFFKP